ncbi:hypothetical protein KIN20_021171 [Parelaphostrongylus tenuis]|uniref:Uncharacterized protein n=1 Tax=Parelaphostrongylus tenuis TaxID=148309 RepID=A0AAD5N401_PARTN|nr:hypothetical protein KIN20_021171 [Parelaphostrongylus tenuis]
MILLTCILFQDNDIGPILLLDVRVIVFEKEKHGINHREVEMGLPSNMKLYEILKLVKDRITKSHLFHRVFIMLIGKLVQQDGTISSTYLIEAIKEYELLGNSYQTVVLQVTSPPFRRIPLKQRRCSVKREEDRNTN